VENESGSPSPPQILALCTFAFVLLAGYAVARSATESLYISAYTSEMLPAVWVAVGFVSVLVVAWYTSYVKRLALVRLFGFAVAISAVTLVLVLLAVGAKLPGSVFVLYIWKDVYIVVLVELFWSFANVVFRVRSAKWMYGLFLLMGALGGITGNLGVGVVAKQVGTANALWLVLPLLATDWLIIFALARSATGQVSVATDKDAPAAPFKEGMRTLRESPYLLLLLLLIGVVQIAITLIDYVYNQSVEMAYPDEDARTAVMGKVYAAIDASSMILQALSGPVLRWIGVGSTLLGVPILLGSAVLGFIAAPRFATMAIAKVASKALDYSLFRAAKEILYIPLTFEEKTRGKALVDMLTYRVAKALVSFLLLGLAFWQAGGWVAPLALVAIVVWLLMTRPIVRRYRERAVLTGEETD
jgi:ATP:ADP antiporter, AAA family